jgi:hypothetical protein
MLQPRLARERVPGALELTLPAVRGGQRLGVRRLRHGKQRERTQSFALRRRGLQLPRELGERPPACPAPHILVLEERDDLVPERARLARAALVGRCLTHERQPTGRSRAGRVEEVPLALDRVGAHKAGP